MKLPTSFPTDVRQPEKNIEPLDFKKIQNRVDVVETIIGIIMAVAFISLGIAIAYGLMIRDLIIAFLFFMIFILLIMTANLIFNEIQTDILKLSLKNKGDWK